MSGDVRVRPATPEDAGGVLAVYGPVVRDTWISFETEVPALEEIAGRIARTAGAHPWLVAEDADGGVAGYARAGPFRSRPAYRWTAEVTVYVREGRRGRGVGRALYGRLLDELRGRGLVTALAVIALPNPGSVTFHEGFGFRPVGVLRNVGFKLGAWRDVGWWSLELRAPPARPDDVAGPVTTGSPGEVS